MGYRERDAAAEIDALFREILPEACAGRDNVVAIGRTTGLKLHANATRGK